MNSSFYESVGKFSKNKINSYISNLKGGLYTKSAINTNLTTSLNNTNLLLQPLKVSYGTNMLIRLNKSTLVKAESLNLLLNTNLSSGGESEASLWANPVSYIDAKVQELPANQFVTTASLFEDNSRFYKRQEGVFNAITIRPLYISDSSVHEIKNSKLPLLTLRYESGLNEIVPKPKPHNNFMVMKQKRYKRRKNIKFTNYSIGSKALDYYDLKSNLDKRGKQQGQILLNRDNSLSYAQEDLSTKYKFFMKNKTRGDDTNIAVSRRMIRTKRTLVLPAHVNITAITNSYDVIHS